MKYIFNLEHKYQQDGEIESKFIGVFSSIEKAQVIIKKLSVMPGFEDFSLDCFIIQQIKIDDILIIPRGNSII